ncbi:MazG nucleotide pyrophosphohydrolase domain-containing protein [Bacteroidota bacterium]
MPLKNYQEEVEEWIQQHKVEYFEPHEIVSCIVEEAGEIAREVNHLHGPKKKKSSEKKGELGVELGDLLFMMICMANSHNIDLDESFRKTMEKRYGRDKDRFERK